MVLEVLAGCPPNCCSSSVLSALSAGVKIVIAVPACPARPVRPTRCTYVCMHQKHRKLDGLFRSIKAFRILSSPHHKYFTEDM